jgi:hypothetical protein
VAPLDGAFALVQVDHVAVRVAQHLDLDVARLLDELLDEDAVVAKLLRASFWQAAKPQRLLVVEGHAQALAAAAGAGLDHHRVADALRDLHRALGRLDGVVVAGMVLTLAASASFLDAILSPMAAIECALGPMKAMPSSSQRLAKSSFSLRKP